MTAAAVTPSVVCKKPLVLDAVTGTPVRAVEYYLKGTKVSQNDWILLETAIGTTLNSMIGCRGIVIDSSNDMDLEDFTYDDSADKLVLAGTTVGTVHVFVRMTYP